MTKHAKMETTITVEVIKYVLPFCPGGTAIPWARRVNYERDQHGSAKAMTSNEDCSFEMDHRDL